MNIVIMGAAGFIGTNLVAEMVRSDEDQITVVDENKAYFVHYPREVLEKIKIRELKFHGGTDFLEITENQEVVYHLISTNNPTTSNKNIGRDLTDNISITINLLEACVKNGVKKIIFISSGGTVYGKEVSCPISESAKTQPINTYGIQKLTIEKLLYLYYHMYGMDYCIIRLSNPYGPYQRPNGKLGVISTFIYNALNQKTIRVYGDGSVIRDYIYIADVILAIIQIAKANAKRHIYNVGSGKGTSVNDIIRIIRDKLNLSIRLEYTAARSVDVPVNYLDISRYENEFGKIETVPIITGMMKTKDYLEQYKE